MATPRVFCRLRLLINNKFSVISKNNIVRNSVFLNKNIQVQVVRHLRTHVGSGVILDKNKPEGEEQEPSSSSSDDSDSDDDGEPFDTENLRSV
ncbi:hypothetical protein WA026_001068 [Henosepilachna vigintioctopunctata]|uniref:Uncharacterized protein n=1 Tax=Henosepilachna vigintioctopunctata TaxID=420089 RepID=A0AAW1V791_9CUCU